MGIYKAGTAAKALQLYNDNGTALRYSEISSQHSPTDVSFYAGIRFLKEATGINHGSSIGFFTDLDQASQSTDYRMYIKNGNVGIGTTNPSSNTLQVAGSAGKTVGGTAWADLSDARLKTELAEVNGTALDKILQMRPIKYEWNDLHRELYGTSTDAIMYGFVAQELMQVVPEFVKMGGDGYYWI